MSKLKIMVFMLIVIISVLVLSGCSKNNELNIQNKIEAEVEFTERGVEVFLKKCELDEYITNNEIDWKKIKDENAVFTNSFSVIESDLLFANLNSIKIDEIKNKIINIDNYVNNNEFDNLRKEYADLYISFESINLNEYKKLKCIIMDMYISAIDENFENLNTLITNLENEYRNIDKNGKNAIELNRIHNIVINMRNILDSRDYDSIRNYCVQMISIL